jgi:hypothetical protein
MMNKDFFSLKPLYEHAEKGNTPRKGDGRGAKRDPAWSTYSQVRDKMMINVPASTGWYVWLKISASGVEEIKYVGKTTKRKLASLQARKSVVGISRYARNDIVEVVAFSSLSTKRALLQNGASHFPVKNSVCPHHSLSWPTSLTEHSLFRYSSISKSRQSRTGQEQERYIKSC